MHNHHSGDISTWHLHQKQGKSTQFVQYEILRITLVGVRSRMGFVAQPFGCHASMHALAKKKTG